MAGTEQPDPQDADLLASFEQRLLHRFATFEERLSDIEDGMREDASRFRNTAQVFDLLSEDIRRTLEGVASEEIVERLHQIEAAVRQAAERSAVEPAHLDRAVDTLAERIGAASPDLEGLHHRLGELAGQISESRLDQSVLNDALGTIWDRLDVVRDGLGVVAEMTQESQPDLTPLLTRLDELPGAIEAAQPDLTRVHDALDRVNSQFDLVAGALDDLGPRVDAAAVDLGPLVGDLDGLRDQLEAVRADTTPLGASLDTLARSVDDIATNARAGIEQLREDLPDLTELMASLNALAGDVRHRAADQEQRFDGLNRQLAQVAGQLGEQQLDLGPLLTEVERIQTALATIDASVERTHPELAQLQLDVVSQVQRLVAAVEDARPDLAPILDAVETGLVPIRAGLSDALDALAGHLTSTQEWSTSMREGMEAIDRRLGEDRSDPTVVTAAITDLRTHLDDTRPDLAPIHDALASLTELARETQPDLAPIHDALAGIRGEITMLGTHVEDTVRATRFDATPVLDAIAGVSEQQHHLRPDLSGLADGVGVVADYVRRLQEQSPSREELESAVSSLSEQIDAGRDDLTPIRAGLSDALEALAEHLTTTREWSTSVLERLGTIEQHVERTGPEALEADLRRIQESLEGVNQQFDLVAGALDRLGPRVDASTPDLAPVVGALDGMDQRFEGLDRQLAELQGQLPGLATDLGPVLTEVERVLSGLDALGESVERTHPELAQVRQELASQLQRLASTVEEARPDLTPVLDDIRVVAERLDEHAPRLTGIESDLDQIGTTVSAVRDELQEADRDRDEVQRSLASVASTLDRLSAQIQDARPDLSPLVDGVANVHADLLGGRSDIGSVAEQLRAVADLLDDSERRTVMLDALDDVRNELRNAVGESGRVLASHTDEAVLESERRMARRIEATNEELRGRIDSQRVLADGLAAQVSSLNAALISASEEPQQLRRDIDRILAELAERMGTAMRDLREEVRGISEPLALRASVETGLERLTGRFQNDTGRILEAVTAAQDDADDRLRRIDGQVTELKRALELARRQSETIPVDSTEN